MVRSVVRLCSVPDKNQLLPQSANPDQTSRARDESQELVIAESKEELKMRSHQLQFSPEMRLRGKKYLR